MAAALWHGGISFGGVISFIFADLIALPLVLIYRKYYGTRLTLRLVRLVLRGDGRRRRCVVEGSSRLPAASRRVAAGDDRRDATSSGTTRRSSTSCSSPCFAVLYWLYRNRERLRRRAGATRSTRCAAMQVEKANAPAHAIHEGTTYYFCSDRCHERFEAEPDRYTASRPRLA